MLEQRPGVVSVVLVNFRGAADTLTAVNHLAELDWPSDMLEVIIVENGSDDDSVERLRAGAPNARLVESASNLGFAGGCNLGVAASTGEYLAFLNSDAKPDSQWVKAAIDTFEADEEVGAVASKVLDWEGQVVDYIDAGLTWFGKGYKPFVGETAGLLGATEKDVLFGTGSAMFVRSDVYRALGGFDDQFFMFYEDVDLGWRLNLAGWKYRYQPASLAFHRHHGAVDKFGSFKENYFLERNALFTLFKNLERRNLDAALPATLALTIRRGVVAGELDSTAYDFRSLTSDTVSTETIPRVTLSSVFAVDQFVEHLPTLTSARDRIQSTRKVTDRALWSLFGRVDVISARDDDYRDGYEKIVSSFDVTDRPDATKVLIITGDPLGVKMAGPAIRAWNMALALSAEHEVRLITLAGSTLDPSRFTVQHVRAGDNRAFAPHELWADVIVFQGHAMAAFDALQHTDKIVVADIYDPMHLEQLEQGRGLPAATWDKQVRDATLVLNEQLTKADFFLCASDRQRMFYLGQLAALGRINPANYADDPDLKNLIDLAPFGFDSAPPRHERNVLKGVRPGIGDEDKILLWGGGLYNWFDPKTLIRAVALLAQTHPNVRLFFQGTKHPHPGVPEMAVVAESRTLASELGVLDSSVFFNDSWVDYADRQNYLMEADVGVSTHFSHVETTFSFRTRILDYLWAGLPMVVTDGDSFAELIDREKLGIVVPANDPTALADALETVLFDEAMRAEAKFNVARVREKFLWENTLAPLLAFVRDPHHAPDHAEQRVVTGKLTSNVASRKRRRKPYGLRHNLGLAAHHLHNGGVLVVVRKVLVRLRSR